MVSEKTPTQWDDLRAIADRIDHWGWVEEDNGRLGGEHKAHAECLREIADWLEGFYERSRDW